MRNYTIGEYIGIAAGTVASILVLRFVQKFIVAYVTSLDNVGMGLALGASLAPFAVGVAGIWATFKAVNMHHKRVHNEDVINPICCNTRCDASSCGSCGNKACPMHGTSSK